MSEWHSLRMVMPAIGDEVEVAYTVPGCGNALYRAAAAWGATHWVFDRMEDREDARTMKWAVRYWRPAAPLPNNGLYPGPLDD